MQPHRAHLTVLSACNSGLGGAAAERMGVSSLAPAAALRAAQATLRNTPGHPAWRHPFFWAPFVYFGP